ncbi:site-specific tyrosine recombinase XerD [Shimia thalassica]|uniref:Site-specific tyrosine recombinase XerD n=1 Tax=Shimia thalassica TaxID=1715693 RepID=A0A0P1IAC4_9RHOB|nr:site-specific integrase [Shimia thalassica]CUK01044.1 site-specific tyrosine recombinase XerD [Shimia thalassica]
MPKQRNIIFASGERFSYLESEGCLPDFWSTLFVTVELRSKLSQNTILSVLTSIRHLRLWEYVNERDLISELADGKFLTPIDIESLYEHFTLTRSEVERSLNIQKSNDVISMQIHHPHSLPALETVSTHQQKNRMSVAARFMVFVGKTMHRHSSHRANLYHELDEMAANMHAKAPKVRRSSGIQIDPNYRSAPPEIYDEVLRLVRVDSPQNPFRANVRLRNQVMFDILFETGARGGEILGLQIGDIDWAQRVLRIVRRHDDANDTRKHQPVAKTEEGQVYVSETLAGDLHQYIMKHRAQIAEARRHPYIFVNHRKGAGYGQPVGIVTFKTRIAKPASRRTPEIFNEITRHGFRHNFNYRLSKKIDEQNALTANDPSEKRISQKEEIQIRMRLNRWRSEKTAETYNLRHIKQKADRLMQSQLDEIAEIKGKSL